MSKKLGLALGSGGSRGVTHLGVLKALEEEGIRPDYIAGCSMGSVVGACYANGMTVERMLSTVRKLKTVHLMDFAVLPEPRPGFFKGEKMQNLLLKNIGDVTFDELTIPFCCVATDLLSGQTILLNKGKVAPCVRASSTIPIIFKPLEMDGMMLVDGGVLCRVPTEQVKAMGADVVIAVDALVNSYVPVKEVKGMIAMILRMFDVMDNNALNMKKKLTADTFDLWLAPEIKDMNQYSMKDIERAYEEGYAVTKANMDKIKQLLK